MEIIENMENIEDDYRSHPKDFCEMLICARKIVNSDIYSEVTNIRKNVQNYSSEFEGLLK